MYDKSRESSKSISCIVSPWKRKTYWANWQHFDMSRRCTSFPTSQPQQVVIIWWQVVIIWWRNVVKNTRVLKRTEEIDKASAETEIRISTASGLEVCGNDLALFLVKEFGVAALHFNTLLPTISTTDMPYFAIIPRMFARIKYVLFPFSKNSQGNGIAIEISHSHAHLYFG